MPVTRAARFWNCVGSPAPAPSVRGPGPLPSGASGASTLVEIWLCLALLSSGCSLIVDDNTHRVVNHCGADADCASGAHCDSTMAMCVQEPSLPYALWLEIAPPNASTATSVTPVDLGPYTSFSGSIPLVVPRQVSVHGTVRQGDLPVTAQITFTPTAMSAVGSRSVSVRTSSVGATDFSASVPSRTDYDVVVEPLGDFRATLPPYRFSLTVGTTDTSLPIPMPQPDPAAQISGSLVDALGAGLAGFEVRAVDRMTGAQVSSVATTLGDGQFTIALAPTTAPFDLVIRPTSMVGLAPTYHVRPEVLLPDAQNHVRVLIPTTVAPIAWGGTVEWPESRGVRAVQGAIVQLHSDDVVDATTGLVGSLDLTLTTDANGVYDSVVLPGNYTVTITAPADPELGVLRETRDLHTALRGHIFNLPLRTVLGGTVQSPDGDVVRDAQVQATPTGAVLLGITNPDVARLARPAQASSDPMGNFRLELDVGVYDIVVEPPDGSGFAWTIDLGYGIGGSTATLADVMQIDAPVVIESDLTWLDGGTLAGAEVRAFGIAPDGRAVMVGRTTSDAHGHARILVPAMLGSHDPTMAFRHP